MEIFKLFGSIFVNTDEAEKNIASTDEKATSFASKLGDGIKTAAKWGAGIVAGAAAGGAALLKMATDAAATSDNIDKMSQKIGVSREAYQELDFICSQNGMSVDQLQGNLKKMVNVMDEASTGSETATEKFARLGLSVTDNNGALKDSETMFYETIAALQGMENETERNAAANDIFGGSYTEMIPLLNSGGESMEELKQKAHDLGLVLSDETVDAGVKFTDTMDQTKRTLSAVVTNIGTSVMPIFQKALEFILEHMPQIQAVFETVFGVIETVVTTVVNVVSGLFTGMGNNFGGVVEGLRTAWDTYGQPLFEAIQPIIETLKENWDKVFNSIKELFGVVMDYLKTAWENIGKPVFDLVVEIIGIVAAKFQEYMPQITEFFGQMVSDIKGFWENNLKPVFEKIKDIIENYLAPAFKFVFETIIGPVVEGAFNGIKDLWNNTLKPIFEGITEFLKGVFTGDWKAAWEGIVKIVDGIFSGIVTVVKTPINAVIKIINSFINGLNKISVPDWVPLIGGKGINIPTIPLLAKGGHITSEGSAIVGEAGAEMVDLPVGATVTPLKGKSSLDNTNLEKKMDAILSTIEKYFPVFSSKMQKEVYLDKKLVSTTVSNELGLMM